MYPSNKDDILVAFDILQKQHEQERNRITTKTEVLVQQKNQNLIKQASEYTVENIINGLAELQLNFGSTLENLSDQIQKENTKLDDLKLAIKVESKTFDQLRNIKITSETLDILRKNHSNQLQNLNEKMDVELQSIEEDAAEQRKTWTTEKAEQEEKINTQKQLLEKQRQQAEEHAHYEMQRSKKLMNDDFEEKQRLLERKLKAQDDTKEKDWGIRLKTLESANQEIQSLKEKTESFIKEKEESVKKSREKAINNIHKDTKVEIELLEKEHQTNVSVLNLKITSLEKKVVEQYQQIADLTKQLNTALEQTQDLATKALISGKNT